MKKMLIGGLMMLSTGAYAAEPIQGMWKTETGELVEGTRCGEQFCLTLKTGKYAGKQIGEFRGDSIHYTGTVTDPKDNKTYEGSAKINTLVSGASTLDLKGCVLKVLCKSRSWNKVEEAK